MNKSSTTIHIQERPFMGNAFEFLIIRRDGDHVYRAKPLYLEVVTPESDCFEKQPTFSLRPEEAQALMDELWRTGIRPHQTINEQSALPYISAHLADMRRLVFEPLKSPTHEEKTHA